MKKAGHYFPPVFWKRLYALKTFTIFIPHNPFSRILLVISFFVFAACFVPVAGSLLLVFLPLLIFFYSAVAGRGKTMTAFFISLAITLLFSRLLHINTPYQVAFVMGISGLAIASVALKNNSIEKTVIYPSLMIIGVICAYFLFAGWTLSINPWIAVQQFIAQMIEQNVNLYSQLPLDKEELDLIKNNKQTFIDFFISVFPALAAIGSVAIVWLNVLMGKNILRRAGIMLPKLGNLSCWRAPEFTIWIFLGAGGLLLVPQDQINFFSLNILLTTCLVYLLQGFAIISFIFQNKKVPLFFRFLLYFLIAVQQFLMIPIIAVGLFDIWVDFRRFFHPDQTASA
jgi:uncharacterized protein YybS (DUF2232 family)